MASSVPVSATAVSVSWTASSLFSTLLRRTTYHTVTEVIMSQQDTVTLPGVSSTEKMILL